MGLHDPRFAHAACGLAGLARLDGRSDHELVERALLALGNLEHRGATGADPDTGDGAGLMLQIPHELYAAALADDGIVLPPPGDYAVANCFLSRDPSTCRHQQAILEGAVMQYGQRYDVSLLDLGILRDCDIPLKPVQDTRTPRDNNPVRPVARPKPTPTAAPEGRQTKAHGASRGK